jgi:hypothetical protein
MVFLYSHRDPLKANVLLWQYWVHSSRMINRPLPDNSKIPHTVSYLLCSHIWKSMDFPAGLSIIAANSEQGPPFKIGESRCEQLPMLKHHL